MKAKAGVRHDDVTDRGPGAFGPALFIARSLLTVIVFVAFFAPFAALASPPKEPLEETPVIEKNGAGENPPTSCARAISVRSKTWVEFRLFSRWWPI